MGVADLQDGLLKRKHRVAGLHDGLLKTKHRVVALHDALLKTKHRVAALQDVLLKTKHGVVALHDVLSKTFGAFVSLLLLNIPASLDITKAKIGRQMQIAERLIDLAANGIEIVLYTKEENEDTLRLRQFRFEV